MTSYFRSRNLRERILLLMLSLVLLAILGGHAFRRGRNLHARWQAARADQALQRIWLARSNAIEANAAAIAKRLDSRQALNATRLVGELDAMAARAGLNPEIGSQRSEHSERLAFHSARVDFRRVELVPLLNFYRELSARSPTIALEQFSLTTERNDPGLLNASFQVVAAGLEEH